MLQLLYHTPAILIMLFSLITNAVAQTNGLAGDNSLTIVYDIKILNPKSKTGIEETYNGGIKTIMRSGNSYRIRMVSLMRIHNIFIYHAGENNQEVIMSKESGAEKYQFRLTSSQWARQNQKYRDATYDLSSKEKKQILGYTCNKALITLKNGQSLTVYYTTSLPKLHKSAEPAFEKIPGLVLEYELKSKQNTINYRASQMETSAIDEAVFQKPGKTFTLRKFDNEN